MVLTPQMPLVRAVCIIPKDKLSITKFMIKLYGRMPGDKNSSEANEGPTRNKYQKRTAAVQSKHDKKPYLHDMDSSSRCNRSCRQGSKGSISTNNCSYKLVPHTDCIRAIKQKIQSQTEEKWKAQDRILGVWVNRVKADYYSSSLAKTRLAQDALCNCGHTMDFDHIIWFCPNYSNNHDQPIWFCPNYSNDHDQPIYKILDR
ncbi:hypothetical protein K0M31_004965 [Melipona bicolor]|uniref:Uncharacterized protein n=1 Tax=Melipona bicolor TaxID=60889 RepID=A0AA40KMY4_9HYME|nr:hypothetical protein K0M31_004965 [Melipona bicolor]